MNNKKKHIPEENGICLDWNVILQKVAEDPNIINLNTRLTLVESRLKAIEDILKERKQYAGRYE